MVNEKLSRIIKICALLQMTIVTALCAPECPSEYFKLLKMKLKSVATDFHYDVKVVLENLSEKVITSESLLRFTIQDTDKSSVANCSIYLPNPNATNIQSTNSNWTYNKRYTPLSGYLYYEDDKNFWFKGAFPVLHAIPGSFSLSVAHPLTSNYTILSNMPLDNVEPHAGKPGWVWSHYFKTPVLMSWQVLVEIHPANYSKLVGNIIPEGNQSPSITKCIFTSMRRHLSSVSRSHRKELVVEHVLLAKQVNPTYHECSKEMFRYLEYETDPEIWNTVVHNFIKSNMRTRSVLLFGTNWTNFLGFFATSVDKALNRYGYMPADTLLAAENGTDSDSPLTLLRKELMMGCVLVATPGCVDYAKKHMKTWKPEPHYEPKDYGEDEPFFQYLELLGHNTWSFSQRLSCLALRDTQPTDDLFQLFLSKNENTIPFCHAIWCTRNETLILNQVKDILENNASSSYEEIKCRPLYGFNGDLVDNDYLHMVEPVYQLAKTAFLKGTFRSSYSFIKDLAFVDAEDKPLNRSSYLSYLQEFKYFLVKGAMESDVVMNDLDNMLETYRQLYDINWEQVSKSSMPREAVYLKNSVTLARLSRTYGKSDLKLIFLVDDDIVLESSIKQNNDAHPIPIIRNFPIFPYLFLSNYL